MIDSGLIAKTIDGKKYEFEKFGARAGLAKALKVAELMGDSVATAFGAIQGGGKMFDRKVDFDVVGKAVKSLVSRLNEPSVLPLIEELTASSCLCDGKRVDFDTHYAGNYGHLTRVLLAAVEVQFGSFLDVVPGAGSMRAVLSAMPSSSMTPAK